MMHLHRTACLLAAALVLLTGGTAHGGPPKRLNIIAIVTDDQGHWAMGAYGNKDIKTPTLDKLARQGARFLRAFTATPVCSPSRASYFSGKWGSQVKIGDWIAPAEAEAGVGLPDDAITWMQVLQKHGYVTGLIGKWHLGSLARFHPTKHGFDHFVGFLGGGNSPMNPTFEVNGKDKKFEGAEPDIVVDHAIEFVKHHKDKPFALAVHFRAPHLPYGPVPKQDSDPFKGLDPTIPKFKGLDVEQVKKWTVDYYASVHSVDRNLARLLAVLDEMGLAENTIIIFTSDHGYMIGHHGLHTKGNANWVVGGVTGPKRPNMFDLSMRVPLLVRWPGVVKPGTEINAMVSNIDTFASVLGMLKVPAPEKYKHGGMDFSPLLRGEKTPWRDAVFGQYDLHNGGLAYMRSIRTERWNLVRHHFANGMDELYDLDNDPDEMVNLYNNAKHQKTRDALLERLVEWQRSIDDPVVREWRLKE
jgi:uncharacterized sulfatase